MDSATPGMRPKIPDSLLENIFEWTEEHVAAFLAENGVRNNGYMELVKKQAIDGKGLAFLARHRL